MDKFCYVLFRNTSFVEPTWRPSACQTCETPLRISFTFCIQKAGSINTKTRQKGLMLICNSWHICSSVQWLGHGVGNRKIGVRFSAGKGGAEILFFHNVWRGSRPHPTSCSIQTKVSFPGCKAAGASNWSLKTAASSGVTDAWSYTSTSPHAFVLRCLIHKKNLFNPLYEFLVNIDWKLEYYTWAHLINTFFVNLHI